MRMKSLVPPYEFLSILLFELYVGTQLPKAHNMDDNDESNDIILYHLRNTL